MYQIDLYCLVIAIFIYIFSDFIPNHFQDMRDPLGTNTGNASIGNEL